MLMVRKQWQAEQQGENWTFKNVATGQYLGIEGNPDENTPVVVVDHPFEWHVTQDDESWRCVQSNFSLRCSPTNSID